MTDADHQAHPPARPRRVGGVPHPRPSHGGRVARLPARRARPPHLAADAAAGARRAHRRAAPTRRARRRTSLRRLRRPGAALPQRQHPPALLGLGDGHRHATGRDGGLPLVRGEPELWRPRAGPRARGAAGDAVVRRADGLPGGRGRNPRERRNHGERPARSPSRGSGAQDSTCAPRECRAGTRCSWCTPPPRCTAGSRRRASCSASATPRSAACRCTTISPWTCTRWRR